MNPPKRDWEFILRLRSDLKGRAVRCSRARNQKLLKWMEEAIEDTVQEQEKELKRETQTEREV